jgi:S1-C subfamily serine protease
VTTSSAKILDSGLKVPEAATSLRGAASVLPARCDNAKVFLRQFIRELIREISPTTKILSLLSAVVLVGGFFYLGHAAFVRYRAQQQHDLSQGEMLTRRIGEQERLLANLSARTDKQISDLTKLGSDFNQTTRSVLYSLSLPNRLWNSYSNGICLIAGSYILIDRTTGRPLRYPGAELTAEERLLIIGTQVPLTPEGKGSIVELEFVGTGFHVGGGYVLTNRHVANQPWAADRRAQSVVSSMGAIPRLEKLLAFFPGLRQPMPLKFRTASESEDVAVCSLKTTPPAIPVLPLDRQSGAIEVGKAVVMMGYATGPNRMLALLPETEAIAIENEYGGSLVTLLDQLAKRKLIKPLTTQGHITDLYKNRIVFGAATSEGSSGTPVLGESGQVIGITFAVLVDDGASNFAIPIATGIEQLKQAGWKAKDE